MSDLSVVLADLPRLVDRSALRRAGLTRATIDAIYNRCQQYAVDPAARKKYVLRDDAIACLQPLAGGAR